MGFLKDVKLRARSKGVYLTAHEALVICGSLRLVEDDSERADVIRRFRQRCKELDRRGSSRRA